MRAVGFDPWLDEIDLLPGQDWQLEINTAIRESMIFIACLSKRSVLKQGYVQKEFRLALSSQAAKPPGTTYLIPLRLDQCEVPDVQFSDLGVKLRDIQWLDYWKSDGFERLVMAIRREAPTAGTGKVTHLVDVISRKKTSANTSGPRVRKAPGTNVIKISGDVEGSIIANTVHVSATRSRRVPYPAGCVGANLHKKNYLAYLIDQYFKFRDKDSSYGATRPFHHAEIHNSIRSKFKVKTYFVPETLFERVCDYVKQRIDRTVLGKNNAHKGRRNYEPYEEFFAKQQ